MHRILCKHAHHAILLADVLSREGFQAVWYLSADSGPAVGTNADIEHIMRAVDTTETILQVPAHKRTRCVEVN